MSLDIFQQVFSLAMRANAVIGEQGTQRELEEYYLEKLTASIQTVEGWDLAWGPTIWKLKPHKVTYPANAGYIAFNPSAQFEDGSVHPTYVIAIAGTPMGSQEVLDQVNNAVYAVVDFNDWVKGGIQNEPVTVSRKDVSSGTSYISKGLAWGTHNLMNATSSEVGISPGQTMVQFLSSLNASTSTRFIVAGHSLGGTLTTTISLTLVTGGTLSRENTLAYPVAAFSAGNTDWAQQWAETFPVRKSDDAGSYQGWNVNLINNLDCVPQLWCQRRALSSQQWLGRIPSIYGRPAVTDVQKTIVKYFVDASISGVVYMPVPTQSFDGSSPASVPTTSQEFTEEASLQHTVPYFREIGVTIDSAGLSASDVAALSTPFTIGLQQAVDYPEDHQKKYDEIKYTAEAQSFLAQLM